MTRKRIATVVYGVYGTLVAAFVVASIVQVVAVCFEIVPPKAKPLPPACAEGIRSMLGAIDRAAGAPDFKASLSPEWDRREAVQESCKNDDDALEAFAEMLRLGRLVETHRGEKNGSLRKRLETRIALEPHPK